MTNIDDIATKEEAHCFLTEGIADIAYLLMSKNGLSKKIDTHMINQDILQKKLKINVDLYTNAIKGILVIKSRQQDRDIKDYEKKSKEAHEKVLDEKY